MELTELRKGIDGIDDELVRLLVRRLQVADAVADVKRGSGLSVLDPAREREILTRASAAAGLDFSDGVKRIFETILTVSRARQHSRMEKGA